MNKDLKNSLKAVASDVLKLAYNANEDKIKKHLSDAQFRKVRKLATNPELFIQDTLDKKKEQARKYLPIKYDGNFNYTVVSAVYNVEKYLDEYFESLVNQSLNFKKHIHLILVDDGSTDNSANIIKKWQKKYPKNIHYYYKENGGQASARNLGLQYVETEWVTFIDPDDFVDMDYFLRVDESVFKSKDLSLVSCPFIFYFEDTGAIKDTHPLRYRFSKTDNIITLKDMGKNIQLSVNSAFFITEHLLSKNIRFHEEVKPNFEDAKFVGDYFASLKQDSKIAFIANTSYFYRKRSDGTSTLDGAWKKPTLYSDVLEKGCVLMLENAKNTLGYVPAYMQRTVLYHLAWYFKYLVNNNSVLSILTDEQKQEFLVLLHRIFEFIDEKTIMEFELAGTWFFQKVAWLGYFKKKEPSFQISYIENIDREKKQFLVYYFSYFEKNAEFLIGGKEIIPSFQKTVSYDFVDTHYVYEHRYWVSYADTDNETLEIKINGNKARITSAGKQHKNGLPINVLLKDFEPKNYNSNPDIWIIMDRDTQADDNGEHLYRYITTNYPEREIYFALNRDSVDWERLSAERFNLLEFGSPKFEYKLRIAGKLISSHLDKYINDYFGDSFEFDKKFVFLQHGITMNDLSSWVNSKKNLQLFVMSTYDEYNAIAGQNSRYKTTKKEALLSGFPRHDALLRGNNVDSKTILIMPTWRKTILGAISDGNAREINPDFMKTDYAQAWQSFIKSPRLLELSQKYGYSVIFAPHANIEPYLDMFDIPNYVQIWRKQDGSIQQLFQESKLMITDYSSVHFEMGILSKAVLYYQFDKESFFTDGHVFGRSYFNYEQHGFGAVAETETDLLMALEQVLQNNGEPVEPYATRIRETFSFRDGKCCERVYQAIVDLDKPDDGTVDLEILADMVESAKTHHAWHLVESRCQKQLEVAQLTEVEHHQSEQNICQAMYMQGKYAELVNFLETTSLNDDEKAYWQMKLDLWLQKYDEVCTYFTNCPAINNQDKLLALLACVHKQDDSTFVKVLDGIDIESLSQAETQMLQVVKFVLTQDNQALSELLVNLLDSESENTIAWTKDELQIYKPQLILAKALIAQEDYKLCYHYIKQYNEKVGSDYASRLLSAQMDFAQANYKWSVVHYENLLNTPVELKQADYTQYLIALCHMGQYKKLADVEIEVLLGDERLIAEWVKAYANQIDLSNVEINNRHQSEQNICQAMYMQGKYAELVNFLETTSLNDDEKAYWQMKLDLWLQKYDEVCTYFTNCPAINNQDKLLALLAYAHKQDDSTFAKVLDGIDIESLSQAETQMLQVVKFVLTQDNQALSELLVNLLDSESENTIAWTKDELQIYKPQLILAKALIAQEDYKLCYHYLNRYKEQVANDYACRLIFAQMDFAKGGYKWCVVHYESLLDMSIELILRDQVQYLTALCHLGQYDKLVNVDIEILLGDKTLLKSWVKLHAKQGQWKILDAIFVKHSILEQLVPYEYALTQYRLGRFDGLDKILARPIFEHPYEYWQLMVEIADLNGNLELQKYCYKGMIAIYPERDKEHNLQLLNELG